MKYIGITGSKVIPYLSDVSRDVDILIVCSDKKEYDEVKNRLQEKYIPGITFIVKLFNEDDKLIYHWAYLYKYLIPIYRENGYIIEDIDILDDKYRLRYINYCKEYINHRIRYNKNWYYLLIGMYILKNNSYNLTENQINNVRLAHSKSISEDLKNEIIDFFNKKED